jgi:single-strand DNA-binding protein
MANGINKVILVGNLGKDPEILKLDSGVKKASFSLATTEVFRNKDGEKTEHTEWHNIVLWRGLAEVAENYLKKGNSIYLEGRIRRREYDDKEGQKKFIYEILGDNMVMIGGPKREGHESQVSSVSEETVMPSGAAPDDDLPF